MKSNVEKLRDWISDSDNIVFFGGAGISTESGIPDFRSVDGLYNQKYKHPPETILSYSFFRRKPEEFFEFYRDKMLYLDSKPNDGHLALAKLEEMGKLKAVITQNIDGLHQKAGSKNVYELHGSVLRNYCLGCGKTYPVEHILKSEGVPRCECKGKIKPDVVLYEEILPQKILLKSMKAIKEADMLIVGGTSLSVYPACELIQYYEGNKLVLINKDDTKMDIKADLFIKDNFGKVMGQALDFLEQV